MSFAELDETRRLEWDRSDMGSLLAQFSHQCRQAMEIGSNFRAGMASGKPRCALVCGMGGSAIAGDVAASWAERTLAGPLLVHRNYDLPHWAGPEDLVVTSSYSGDTEETLSSYARARQVGAEILAITTGGELARRCAADGVPLIKIPGGMPPRCAFGFSFFTLIHALADRHVIEIGQNQLSEAIETLERLSQECHWSTAEHTNQAKQIARHLEKSLPVIYASADLLGPAARRWANQINENAKQPSYAAFFPELCHNEIVGWDLGEGPAKGMSVVMLGDPDDHRRNVIRSQAVAELVGDAARAVLRLEGKGQGLLARMLYLIHLGDWVSYYLAWLNRVDPTPIGPIVKLKNILKEAK
jgi:glucose/mannose-6-phosphate isomerase